jgi:signal transduction histidine kinase
MKLTLGIRTQLVAGIIIITLAAMGLLGVLSIKVVESNAVYRKVREAETMARLMRAATIEAPWRTDTARVVEYAKRIMRDAGIYALLLRDSEGRVLLKEGELPAGGVSGPDVPGGSVLFFDDGIKVRSFGGGRGGWLWGPPGFLHISVVRSGFPPASTSGAHFAFSVSLSDIGEDLARISRFLLFYAAVDSLVIIAIGTYFLSLAIIRPIKRLEGTATRIARGDLEERADVTIDNEIGRLAGAFNTMAGRLEDEIKRLGRTNEELVETQEELLRSSTLAAVGRLAAGLAHEIGNPLGAVRGYLDILSKGIEDKDEEKEILERSEKEVSRINNIVREFLDIARPPKGPPAKAHLNDLVADTVSVMSGHGGFEGVKTELVLKEGIPPVMIDEGKVRQVFINLLLNAADAMEGTGVITVKTGMDERTDEDSRRGGRRRGDPALRASSAGQRVRRYVSVVFHDTGCGISEEELPKIFDPFYTTKVKGGGTGLGLFVSQGIIKAYGGKIEVESSSGKGSAFKVLLPVAKDENTRN